MLLAVLLLPLVASVRTHTLVGCSYRELATAMVAEAPGGVDVAFCRRSVHLRNLPSKAWEGVEWWEPSHEVLNEEDLKTLQDAEATELVNHRLL